MCSSHGSSYLAAAMAGIATEWQVLSWWSARKTAGDQAIPTRVTVRAVEKSNLLLVMVD